MDPLMYVAAIEGARWADSGGGELASRAATGRPTDSSRTLKSTNLSFLTALRPRNLRIACGGGEGNKDAETKTDEPFSKRIAMFEATHGQPHLRCGLRIKMMPARVGNKTKFLLISVRNEFATGKSADQDTIDRSPRSV